MSSQCRPPLRVMRSSSDLVVVKAKTQINYDNIKCYVNIRCACIVNEGHR